MKNVFKVSFIVIALLFIACSKDDVTVIPTSQTNTTDAITSSGCDITIPYMKNGFKATYGIYADGEEDGDQVFEFDCSSGDMVRTSTSNIWGQQSSSVNTIKVENNYILVKSNLGDYYTKPYKHNCELGDTWEDVKSTGARSVYEVIAVDSMVTVPAGNFKCKLIKRTATDSSFPDFALYNEDVGLVYQDLLFYGILKLKEVTN